ncbi:hypothetical protein BDV96DRAFT_199100 [Lophiotrema nucula]|uniref:DUF7730 domain-containing protein n=1 Tax=Lophiotrema nucula TaxID=690887 RepID=A0A6A5YU71_9PLEO|nr:hypothetical protein BDV96DRAFT_199100 [Lophiotrema nucula]
MPIFKINYSTRYRWKKRIENAFFWIILSPLFPFFLIYEYTRKPIRKYWRRHGQPHKKWLEKQYEEKVVNPRLGIINMNEIEERKKRREERDGVKRLPGLRARRLSLGSAGDEFSREGGWQKKNDHRSKKPRTYPTKEEAVQQSTFHQGQDCHLYRLPYEIRDLIWQYALGGHHIHIVKRRGRLGSVYCPAEDPLDDSRKDLCLLSRNDAGFYTPTAWPPDVKPLGLLRSCRQIYSEAIEYLYSLNTFSFDDFTLLPIFLSMLLPQRRKLIASLHVSWDFTEGRPSTPREFHRIYEPRNDPGQTWSPFFYALNGIPSLRNLAVTRNFVLSHRSVLSQDLVRLFLELLNNVNISGRFRVTIPWPEGIAVANHVFITYSWTANDDLLPEDLKFTIKRMPPQYSSVELLSFFLPFNIRCLHCLEPRIIRKAVKGFAEAVLYRADTGHLQSPPWPLSAPMKSVYWTFHAHCGGWIEFQYDWNEKSWIVTQGARRVNDQEAERMIAESGGTYAAMENPHENLHGVQVKAHPMETNSPSTTGRAIDIPTKEAYYRNFGWTRDERPNIRDFEELA